jgi:hypothetical protein
MINDSINLDVQNISKWRVDISGVLTHGTA